MKSPPVRWNHHDSLAVWARTMSSSMPHLQAAHWMISSVVPTKLPGDPPIDRRSDAGRSATGVVVAVVGRPDLGRRPDPGRARASSGSGARPAASRSGPSAGRSSVVGRSWSAPASWSAAAWSSPVAVVVVAGTVVVVAGDVVVVVGPTVVRGRRGRRPRRPWPPGRSSAAARTTRSPKMPTLTVYSPTACAAGDRPRGAVRPLPPGHERLRRPSLLEHLGPAGGVDLDVDERLAGRRGGDVDADGDRRAPWRPGRRRDGRWS